jgi:hypothetical protein
MLIPEQLMLEIDVTTLDVTDSRESRSKPQLHTMVWNSEKRS